MSVQVRPGVRSLSLGVKPLIEAQFTEVRFFQRPHSGESRSRSEVTKPELPVGSNLIEGYKDAQTKGGVYKINLILDPTK